MTHSIHVKDGIEGATLTAAAAIVIYHGPQTAYASVHPLICDEQRPNRPPRLGVGVPVDRLALAKTLRELLHAGGLEILPSNVLSVGSDYVVWWQPPSQRGIWFASGSIVGERAAVTPHPGLIFVAVRNDLFVAATDETERPAENSPLYLAPYCNVWADGRVCQGNVEFPKTPVAANVQAYDEAFFNSRFTHLTHNKKLTSYRGGIAKLWRDLLDGKHETFPQKTLIARNQTLREFATNVIGGRHAST